MHFWNGRQKKKKNLDFFNLIFEFRILHNKKKIQIHFFIRHFACEKRCKYKLFIRFVTSSIKYNSFI